MPRKKRTTYELKLGNTEERPGHRRDCAQVSCVVRVSYPDNETHDSDLALRLVQDVLDGEGECFVFKPLTGVTVEFKINAARAVRRDVKVVS